VAIGEVEKAYFSDRRGDLVERFSITRGAACGERQARGERGRERFEKFTTSHDSAALVFAAGLPRLLPI
jgi:hypothetical protein